MRIRLESRPGSFAIVVVLASLLLVFCWVAISRYRAETFASRNDRASLERAISLETGDAEYHQRLARYALYGELSASSALREFQISSELNPFDANNWLGIAQAQLVLGNEAQVEEATRRALVTDPHTPQVAWEAGNLFVALGKVDTALPLLRLVLANDPAMVVQGLQLIHRVEPSASKAAALGLPADPTLYFVFMNQLVQNHELESAKQVWQALIRRKQPVVPSQSFYFFNALMAAKDYDAARSFWQELGSISGDVAQREQPGNLLHNASFEFPFLDGGLDWHYVASTDVYLSSDVGDSHDGRRSLLVVFHGERATQIGVMQTVLLEPNTGYRFRGYIKSNLQTANGVRFTLVDPDTQQHLFDTAESTTDAQWKEYNTTFRTGSTTRVGLLLMGRESPTLIRGSLLIDDLHLEKVTR